MKVAPLAQRQRFKRQKGYVGSGFSGQWVAAVVLVAALAIAMASAEQR
jgi:hypothetical protein